MIPGTERVTAADVKHAAELVLKDDRAFRLEVEPQGKVAEAQAKLADAQSAAH